MANKKNMSHEKKKKNGFISIYLPISKNSKLTPFLSQSHFGYSLVKKGEDPLKNFTRAFSPKKTHFHQLKAFSTIKQKQKLIS